MKALILLIASIWICSGYASERTVGFALIIGQKAGDSSVKDLEFSESDATRMYGTLKDVSRFSEANMALLTKTSRQEILEQMAAIEKKAGELKRQGIKTKVIFYYSGHASLSGFSLEDEEIDFRTVKKFLASKNFDISIGFIDACYSGNILAMKGGKPGKSFEIDIQDNLSVQGTAILTSSAVNQRSQEWKNLRSSLFTHYLISGLQGAADANKDSLVNVQELYGYTRNEVLDKTSNSLAPEQHPSYLINFKGSGQVVLSDISKAKAKVILTEELDGQIYIKNLDTNELNEVTKKKEDKTVIALPAGNYQVTLKSAESAVGWKVNLVNGTHQQLNLADATPVSKEVQIVNKGTNKRGFSKIGEAFTEFITVAAEGIQNGFESVKTSINSKEKGSLQDTLKNFFSGIRHTVNRNRAKDKYSIGFGGGTDYQGRSIQEFDASNISFLARRVFWNFSVIGGISSMELEREASSARRTQYFERGSKYYIGVARSMHFGRTELRGGVILGSGTVIKERLESVYPIVGLPISAHYNVSFFRFGFMVTPYASQVRGKAYGNTEVAGLMEFSFN